MKECRPVLGKLNNREAYFEINTKCRRIMPTNIQVISFNVFLINANQPIRTISANGMGSKGEELWLGKFQYGVEH